MVIGPEFLKIYRTSDKNVNLFDFLFNFYNIINFKAFVNEINRSIKAVKTSYSIYDYWNSPIV